MDPGMTECGELDSPVALLLQQLKLEVEMEAGLLESLDFHSPEYAKFRVEGEMQENNVEVISPCKGFSQDSPSDSDSIFDISGNSLQLHNLESSIEYCSRVFQGF